MSAEASRNRKRRSRIRHGYWGRLFGPVPTMRSLVLGLLLFALAGCKHPGSVKLEGRWKGQRAEGIPDTVQLAGNSFANATEIVAQGNQLTIQTPAGKSAPATYFVDKEDPTTLVIHTDRDGSTETFTFNEHADVMTWKIDAQRSITFRKAVP